MKQFLLKIVLYGLFLLWVESMLVFLVKDPMSASSHEANVRLASERIAMIEEPKIVIIGGSGCQFGFLSELLASHFHCPVVNTGTHACVGLQLQVNLFKDHLKPGDIVLLIPEYDQYCSKNLFLGCADESMLRIMLTNYPKGLQKLTFEQWRLALPFLPQYISKSFAHHAVPAYSPYSITSINEYGDATNWDCRKAVFKDNPRLNPLYANPDSSILAFIQDFAAYCRANSIRCLLFPPAIAQMESEQIADYIQTLYQALESKGTSFCVRPERYVLLDSLFFDTYYHMTYEGACLRTQMMINDMDSIFNIMNN